MAAITPASIRQLTNGRAVRMLVASFTSVNDADTWTSGLKGVITAVPIDKTGTTTAGVAASQSSGVFTFKTATAGKAVDLLVIGR